MAETTNNPATRSARAERSAKATPSGSAVAASPEVVDEIGQQRDRAGRDEHQRLGERGQREDEQ
jgi:hypothetical protein